MGVTSSPRLSDDWGTAGQEGTELGQNLGSLYRAAALLE